jgi:hypothetical protein
MWHGGPGTHQHSHAHQEAPSGPVLDLVLELNGEWHAKQPESGIKDPNSGGNSVYIAPGLRLYKDNWSSVLSVGIPSSTISTASQSEPDIRLTGVSFTF